MEKIQREIDRLNRTVADLDKQIEARKASRESNPLVLSRALALARIGGLNFALENLPVAESNKVSTAELAERIRALPSDYTAWSYYRMPQGVESEVLDRVLKVIEAAGLGEIHAEDRV